MLLKFSFDSTSNFYLNCNSSKKENENNNNNINWGDMSWFIVKLLKTTQGETGYRLNPGDMIKLGRIKLKICDIKLPGYEEVENKNNNENDDQSDKDNIQKDQLKNELRNKTCSNLKNIIVNPNEELTNKNRKEDNRVNKNGEKDNKEINSQLNNSDRKRSICRICYCTEKELESPLIRPCNCSGTMKYIHFCCLQKWLKSKIVVKNSSNESTITYSFKLVECELCKTLLPDFIKYKNNLYEIWDFTKPPFKQYISFETVSADRNNKILYIVNLENKQTLKIGRGHDSDVRITDISVSRFHSAIKKTKDGKLILEDNNSKFGTLALIQNPNLNILNDNPLSIQIGRTIININVKLPCSIFRCLFKKYASKKNLIDYQILNQKFISRQNHNNIKIQNESVDSEYYITDHLETEKEKENKAQNSNYKVNNKQHIDIADGTSNLKRIEESKNNEIELNISYGEVNLNNNNIQTNNFNNAYNTTEKGINEMQIHKTSNKVNAMNSPNIIIVEKDESKEIKFHESEIFNKILDPNLKTERDNERQIMEFLESRRKEELITDRENEMNYNSTEKIKISENEINQYSQILVSNKKKHLKDEIDLKISDLKNLNLFMKNKLEGVETSKTLKKNSKKKFNRNLNGIDIDRIEKNNINKKISNSQNNFGNQEDNGINNNFDEYIEDLKPKETIGLAEINFNGEENYIDEKNKFSDLRIENDFNNKINIITNNKTNSNKNINNFLNNNNNENSLITNTNTNIFNNNSIKNNTNTNLPIIDLSYQSRNKNTNKIEMKRTADITLMNSFVPNNNIGSNQNNFNNNNYLISHETDNENFYVEEFHNQNTNRDIEYLEDNNNNNNLVLNAVININEINNLENSNGDFNNINFIEKENDNSNGKKYYFNSASKIEGINSFSENLKNLLNKQILDKDEIKNEYVINSDKRIRNHSKNLNNIFDLNEIKINEEFQVNDKNLKENKNDNKPKQNDNISNILDHNVIVNSDDLNNKDETENLKMEYNLEKPEFIKKDSFSAKSKIRHKLKRNINENLNSNASNYAGGKKFYMEDFEPVNFYDINDNVNYENNENLTINYNKSVNSENEIINKKTLQMKNTQENDIKKELNNDVKIKHVSENLNNIRIMLKRKNYD